MDRIKGIMLLLGPDNHGGRVHRQECTRYTLVLHQVHTKTPDIRILELKRSSRWFVYWSAGLIPQVYSRSPVLANVYLHGFSQSPDSPLVRMLGSLLTLVIADQPV